MLNTIISCGILVFLIFLVKEFLNNKINILHWLMLAFSSMLFFKPSIEKTMVLIMFLILIALLSIKIKISSNKK